MMLVVLVIAVLLLAHANGANDNFKATATLYGSATLSYRAALITATAAQLLGSITSVALAGRLLEAFSGKGLVDTAAVGDPAFLIAVAGAAALTVMLATRLGLPISTTHALIGALVGSGLVLSATGVAWGRLSGTFLLPLLVSPLTATIGAGAIYPVASWARRRTGIDEATCLCIGRCIEPVVATGDGALVIQSTSVALTIEQARQCEQRYVGRIVGMPAHRLVDVLHGLSGIALGFARGLNDTPKIMALLVAASWSGINGRVSLALTAVVMAAGGLLHSRRIAETLGCRITDMNRGQGFIANLVASTLVIGSSAVGWPVSTTHVSTGAIFGIGLWTGRAHWLVVSEIILAWVITLPMAAAIAWIVARTL